MSGLKPTAYLLQGGIHEPMISPALRNTVTVNPLTPSPPSLSSVSKRSLSVHRTPAAASGTHSASFAATLRKLAKQAEESRGYSDSSYSDDISPASLAAVNPRTPSCSPRKASAGSQRSVKPTPAVTIAPNEAGGDLWRNEGSQQFAIRPSSYDPHSATPLLKQEKAAMSPVPTRYIPRNTAMELPYSSVGLQRPVQQVIPPGKRPDGYQTGFHPDLSRDAIRPLPAYPGLDTTSCFYPAFLGYLPLQPSLYRFSSPLPPLCLLGRPKTNIGCPLKCVLSAYCFFTHCGFTTQPPRTYSVGGQRSSRAADRQACRRPARLQGSLVRGEPRTSLLT